MLLETSPFLFLVCPVLDSCVIFPHSNLVLVSRRLLECPILVTECAWHSLLNCSMLLKRWEIYTRQVACLLICSYFSFFLQVNIRKSVKNDEETGSSLQEKDSKTDRHGNQMPIVRKSKLLIVDLAGSERIDKSGLLLFHTNQFFLISYLTSSHIGCFWEVGILW